MAGASIRVVCFVVNATGAACDGLSTLPLWRTVTLMSVISNLLLVSWEQHASYKLLPLVTSSGRNNGLGGRTSPCETGVNRMGRMYIILKYILNIFWMPKSSGIRSDLSYVGVRLELNH